MQFGKPQVQKLCFIPPNIINITDFYYAQKCTTLRRYAKDVTDDLRCDLLDETLSHTPTTRRRLLDWGDIRLTTASQIVPPVSKPALLGWQDLLNLSPISQRPGAIPGLVNHSLKIVTSLYQKLTMVPRWVRDSPFSPKVLSYLATLT